MTIYFPYYIFILLYIIWDFPIFQLGFTMSRKTFNKMLTNYYPLHKGRSRIYPIFINILICVKTDILNVFVDFEENFTPLTSFFPHIFYFSKRFLNLWRTFYVNTLIL